ncbi:MAG: tyrosine-type recombinase/integrase, partial [Vicinamibacteria bacterium]
MRPEEARALQWGDIGARTIRVERVAAGSRVKSTKTGELRTVRLLSPLAADLDAWREASGYPPTDGFVFPTRRGTLWTDYDWRNWRRRVFAPVAEAVGMEGSRPYDLRHSFASLLISEGQTVIDVARQMGNAPDVTLKTYAHVFEEFDPGARVSAVDAIEAARAEFDVRGMYAEPATDEDRETGEPASVLEADARTRTADPFITRQRRVRYERPQATARGHEIPGKRPVRTDRSGHTRTRD